MSHGRTLAAAVAALAAVAAMTVVAGAALQRGFLRYRQFAGKPYAVTYDRRSLFLDGERSLFLSGSVHPPRATPDMWGMVFDTAVSNGLNMIELYVFWNYHEEREGHFDWSISANLTDFVRRCGEHDLFVTLRIGPYVCAEWNYGGLPVWLGFKPGIEFRCHNDAWMRYMERWFRQVVDLLEPQFATHGGPIVLVQVENELNAGPTPRGRAYVEWCGRMANDALVRTPVPVIMCNGDSATDTINTCNSGSCTEFLERHGQSGRILIDQPPLWTESSGGFQVWGDSPTKHDFHRWGRSAEDLSNGAAQWFARGGSHMNYYMYFGGNNYARWAAASVTSMYDADVVLCPDMLPHEPKYSHMGRFHEIIAKYADVIVNSPAQLDHPRRLEYYNEAQRRWVLGTQQIAYVYERNASGIAFLENQAPDATLRVRFNGVEYLIPPASSTLVDIASSDELYNTVNIMPSAMRRATDVLADEPLQWRVWSEPVLSAETTRFPTIRGEGPYEMLNITQGLTEYMYYSRNITLDSALSAATLTISTTSSNAFIVLLDGKPVAAIDNHSIVNMKQNLSVTLSVPRGTHELSLLCESLGISNAIGACSAPHKKGILGLSLGGMDLTKGAPWLMRPALAGEALRVFTDAGSRRVAWSDDWRAAVHRPLTWIQTTFVRPSLPANHALLLNATGLGRGHLYVNGHDAGRYWLILRNDGSGIPTQSVYHIPHAWLRDGDNLLTVIEVLGATDPSRARLVFSHMVPGPEPYVPNTTVSCHV